MDEHGGLDFGGGHGEVDAYFFGALVLGKSDESFQDCVRWDGLGEVSYWEGRDTLKCDAFIWN